MFQYGPHAHSSSVKKEKKRIGIYLSSTDDRPNDDAQIARHLSYKEFAGKST